MNKHFIKQLNGLEKGGQLTKASQSNAIETVIMIIYNGSYVAEPRSIHYYYTRPGTRFKDSLLSHVELNVQSSVESVAGRF